MTTKQQITHTPTPWDLLEEAQGNFIARDGKQIARVLRGEDAAFIVRAVNSHEELLEAARLMLLTIPRNYSSLYREAILKMEKAIAKAEGK